MRGCVRYDEAIENDCRVTKPGLDILDRFKKLNLRVRETEIANAFQVYKRNVLLAFSQKPDNEVRVEIARFEKPTPRPLLCCVADRVPYP